MERLVTAVERVGGVTLGLVAALTFALVVLRYGFATGLPDGFDFSCLLQGIAIFWGIAVCTHRNGHIVVDLAWEVSGPRGRRWIDVVAAAITFGFLGLFAWVLVTKVQQTYQSNQLTYDLRLPIWPFHLAAGLGIAAAAGLGALRLWRLLRRAPAGAAGDG